MPLSSTVRAVTRGLRSTTPAACIRTGAHEGRPYSNPPPHLPPLLPRVAQKADLIPSDRVGAHLLLPLAAEVIS